MFFCNSSPPPPIETLQGAVEPNLSETLLNLDVAMLEIVESMEMLEEGSTEKPDTPASAEESDDDSDSDEEGKLSSFIVVTDTSTMYI